MIERSMLLITTMWQDAETFKMIPTSTSCPYVECIFDKGKKILAVIGINKHEGFHMIPRLDESGSAIVTKTNNKVTGYKQQRVSVISNYEYYIIKEDEIRDFLVTFATNSASFDYEKFFNVETPAVEEPVIVPDKIKKK